MERQRLSGACTIVSPNYLAFARVLAASYKVQHPEHLFFVLIVADLAASDGDGFSCDGDIFRAVMLTEIGIPDLRKEAMKYEILELNTNVKPTFMKFLLERYGLENLIYLDPDIFVYERLTPVYEALEKGASAVLTPHITSPYSDEKRPSEQDHLYNGTYNLGFIAIRRCDEALRILSWWERRCLDLGFSEGRTGLFVDQKWMNLAPGLFEAVEVLRHPGCNMAYWNLHERELGERESRYVVKCEGGREVPLCFYHFSGVVVEDGAVLSKHTDRFTLQSRPDLAKLFFNYKVAVREARSTELESRPYGFDSFSDGTAVTRLARRLYAMQGPRWAGENPFDAGSGFARYALRRGLVKDKVQPRKATWKEFRPTDRRVAAVHFVLKLTLKLLGPNRYELLMRYLAHIAVLRNQSVFLDEER